MREKVSKMLKYLQIKLVVFFLIFFHVFESHADEDLGKIGIDFDLPITEKGIELTFIFPIAPAYIAGLRPGDMITHIDGLEIINSNLTDQEVINKILGPIGTLVNITITREGKKLNLDIIRRDSTLLKKAFNLIVQENSYNRKQLQDIFPDLPQDHDIFLKIEYLENALDFLIQYKEIVKKNHYSHLQMEIAMLDLEISGVQSNLAYEYHRINKIDKFRELSILSYKNLSSVYEKFPNLIINGTSFSWELNLGLYVEVLMRYNEAITFNNENFNTSEKLKIIDNALELLENKIQNTKNEDYLYWLKILKGRVYLHYAFIHGWSNNKNKKEDWLDYLLKAEKHFIEISDIYWLNKTRSEIAYVYTWGVNPDYEKASTYFKKITKNDEFGFQAYFELGLINIEYLNKWEEGIANLKKAKENLILLIKDYPLNVQREILDREIEIFDYLAFAYLNSTSRSRVLDALSIFDGHRNVMKQKYNNHDIKLIETNIKQFQNNLSDNLTAIRYMTLNEANEINTDKNEIRTIEAFRIEKNSITPTNLEKNLDDLIIKIKNEMNFIFNIKNLNEKSTIKTITIENIILTEEQKSSFEEYKNYSQHKAFAINPYGSFGYYYGALDLSFAKKSALNYCNLNVNIGGTACKIYTVNDKIVENDNIYELKSFDDLTRDEKLFKIIKYYRSLITKPKKTNDEKNKQHKLSRWIYSAIVEPVIGSRRANRGNLIDKKNLIIVPDSIFYLFPFETLIDHNNEYLVENYNIYYLNTLQSLNIFHNQKINNQNNSLLAFGGAKYNSSNKKIKSIAFDDILEPQEIAQINSQILNKIDINISIRSEYEKLGIKYWPNLPGTLDEVNNISNYFQNSKILTGEKVSENKIKAMSNDGELEKYKIIHFATHGFIHSDIPELSALVLSQIQVSDEDNYLNLKEISNLKLNSDLVVLSACNTGVGTLYHGVGVINISNAFFNAGTKAVMMSLWFLADENTSLFMRELYKKISIKKYSYVEALNEVKREYIREKHGENNKDPFFWAPIIYYGLDQTFN